MPKVSLPSISIHASGTVARRLTFERGPHGPRSRFNPPTPRNVWPEQAGMKASIRFLTTSWATVSDVRKATWAALVPHYARSNYHAYLKYNLDRWRQFKMPSAEYPASETGTIAGFQAVNPTAGPEHIRWNLQSNLLHDVWGVCFCSLKGSDPPLTWTTAVYLVRMPTPPPSFAIWYHALLTSGTWWTRYARFTTTGKVSTWSLRTPVVP